MLVGSDGNATEENLMKLTMTQRIAAAVAAGTMLVGVGATAAAAENTAPDQQGDRVARVEQRVDARIAKLDCAKADEAKQKVDAREARIAERLGHRVERLQGFEQKAKDAGHDQLATRIGKRVERLQGNEQKLPGFADQVKAKIDARCSTAG